MLLMPESSRLITKKRYTNLQKTRLNQNKLYNKYIWQCSSDDKKCQENPSKTQNFLPLKYVFLFPARHVIKTKHTLIKQKLVKRTNHYNHAKKNLSLKNVNLKQPTFYVIWIQTKHFIITQNSSKTQEARNMI